MSCLPKQLGIHSSKTFSRGRLHFTTIEVKPKRQAICDRFAAQAKREGVRNLNHLDAS
jgi:hypothetical protein